MPQITITAKIAQNFAYFSLEDGTNAPWGFFEDSFYAIRCVHLGIDSRKFRDFTDLQVNDGTAFR